MPDKLLDNDARPPPFPDGIFRFRPRAEGYRDTMGSWPSLFASPTLSPSFELGKDERGKKGWRERAVLIVDQIP